MRMRTIFAYFYNVREPVDVVGVARSSRAISDAECAQHTRRNMNGVQRERLPNEIQ